MNSFYKVSLVFVFSCLSVLVYGQQYNESDFGKFYLRLGVNLPQGHFKNAFDSSIPLYQNIDQQGGMSAGTGINLEFGKYYFLHEDPIQEMIKIGLDASFLSVGYNPIKWPPGEGENAFNLFTFSVKFGPVVSFNVLEDFYADIFIKAAPTLITSSSDFVYVKGGESDDEFLDFLNGSPNIFALRSDVGVNIRHKKTSLTLGYESGSLKNSSLYSDGIDYVEYEGKMPMGIFQVKLGFQVF